MNHLSKLHYSKLPPKIVNTNPSIHPLIQSIYYANLLQTLTKTLNPSSFTLHQTLHSHIIKLGLFSDRFVGNSLLSFYFKLCPDFSLTRLLFDELPNRDVVSWTSILSGYVRVKKPGNALQLFVEMTRTNIVPNEFSLAVAINACKDLEYLEPGKCYQASVLVHGFCGNDVISSSLIDLYGKCGMVDESWKLFDEMGYRNRFDMVNWTTMISIFVRNDKFDEAIWLFYKMARMRIGLVMDQYVFGSIFTAFGNLGKTRLKQGKEVHAKIIASGLEGNVVVESSVLDMYGKCGLVGDSRKVFDRMRVKNVVSWCALLNGYCQSGEHENVLRLFRKMDIRSDHDHYSFGTVLRACTGLSAIRVGKEIHCRFLRTGGLRNVIVESALVDLYAKCGSIDCAYRVFCKMTSRNMISWNVIISGLAQNGRTEKAVELFDEMISVGVNPDHISFIGVLFACGHAGMVDLGKKYFNLMREGYKIKPRLEHYNCMVDLLGRNGLIEEAEELINSSEFRDEKRLWTPLLGACAIHLSTDVAERVARKMIELDPTYHLSYVLLANVYKMVGRWNDALEIRKLMSLNGAKKETGMSWIGMENENTAFCTSTDSDIAHWLRDELKL